MGPTVLWLGKAFNRHLLIYCFSAVSSPGPKAIYLLSSPQYELNACTRTHATKHSTFTCNFWIRKHLTWSWLVFQQPGRALYPFLRGGRWGLGTLRQPQGVSPCSGSSQTFLPPHHSGSRKHWRNIDCDGNNAEGWWQVPSVSPRITCFSVTAVLQRFWPPDAFYP